MSDVLVLARAAMDMFRVWDVRGEAAIAMLGGRDEPSQGVLDRVIVLLCIHEGLRGMFREPARIRRWLHSPNGIFDNRAPLALIADGNLVALRHLKDYLFAEIYGA